MSKHRVSAIPTICPIVKFINDSNRSNGFLLDDDVDVDYDTDDNSSTAPTSSFDNGDDVIDATTSPPFDHNTCVDYNKESSLSFAAAKNINTSQNSTTDIAIDNINAVVSTNTITAGPDTNNSINQSRRRKPLFVWGRMFFPTLLQKPKQMKEGRKKEEKGTNERTN